MSIVREHCGGGREPEIGEFRTMSEMQAIPFVAWWAARPGFVRFSLSSAGPGSSNSYLSAEFTDGKSWVAGIVSPSPASDLRGVNQNRRK